MRYCSLHTAARMSTPFLKIFDNPFFATISKSPNPLQCKVFGDFFACFACGKNATSAKNACMLLLAQSGASKLAAAQRDAKAADQRKSREGERMAKGDRTSVAKRAQCLATYVDTGSIEAAARAAGINHQTARGIVDNNVDIIAETKKTAQERMQHYIDSRLDRVQLALDKIVDDLPDKLDKANALQSATVLGILMDKFGGQRDFSGNAVQVNVTFGGGKNSLDSFK